MPYDSRPDTLAHIDQVRQQLGHVIDGLKHRAEVHDASKLVSPEVEVFDEYTPKLKGSTYGSDEYKSFLARMRPALEHHYFNNRHHPEFFAFVGVELHDDKMAECQVVRQMDLLDIIEMLCDWKAATMRHADGDLRKSIEINQKRFGYSDELKAILVNTAERLQMIDALP